MKSALLALPLLALSPAVLAQDPSFHASLRDRIGQGFVYGDLWGNGTLGFIGRWGFDGTGNNDVDIIDLSNPDNIVKLATYSVPAPGTNSSAQDMQSTNQLLFVGLEASASNGVDIVDIRTPGSPVHKTWVNPDPGVFEIIHDVFQDNGWLYLCNSRDTSLAIVDLRSYDVNSPPASITSWAYRLDSLGDPGAFVHDMSVRNGELYVSGWGSLEVWNVANLASSAPSFLGEVRGFNVHSDWPSDDEAFLVTCEERQGGGVRLYQMVRNGNSVALHPRDSITSPQSGVGQTYCAHDPRVVGDRVYISNYSAGVMVLQVDRTNWTFEKVASYDTSGLPGTDFFGCWGVYPFLGADRVIASDLEQGFHVLDFSALELSWPSARPTLIPPGQPRAITVRVQPLGNKVLSAVALHTSIDGAAFQSAAMTNLGGGLYGGDLPALACGSKVDYYVRATATPSGEAFTSPASAPAGKFTAYAGDSLATVLADDFQSDLGWSVSNSGVTSGAWVRGNPVASGAQPESGDPDAAGANCFITGNGSSGGSVSEADLDGGPTRLSSPNLDFSGGDGLIGYKRWFFSNGDTDSLQVEVSNNAGASWTSVETIKNKAGGWVPRLWRVSDFVAPTNQVRVRFSISDNPNDSVTEAGVDSFSAARIECAGAPPAGVTSRNGTSVNVTCFSNLTLPVLGTNWDTLVSHGHHAGATITFVVGRAAPTTGPIIAAGEVLVSGPRYFIQGVGSSGTADTHSVPVPSNLALVGVTAYTQGLILGGGPELCNALDATIGF